MVQDYSSSHQAAQVRHLTGIVTDFVHLALATIEIDRLLQLACVQAIRGAGTSHSKILCFRPDTGDLLMVAGVGWRPDVVGHAAFRTDLASPAGRALRTRQLVMQDDAPHDRRFRYSTVLHDHGIRSLLNAPISVSGVVWGVLEVDSETAREFGPEESWFLCALASALGVVLHGRSGMQRAREAEAKSALALSQEQTLLAELRHRSKNDLQLILTMLALQKRKHTNVDLRNSYEHISEQVVAIGLAHDQLAPDRDAGKVELAGYLQALCAHLRRHRKDVWIEARVEPASIPHAVAVPLGLIVNELVTNALKYAFPDGRSGTVSIASKNTGNGEGCLLLCDDGVGMGSPRSGGSGMELARRLAGQIGGRLEREAVDQGTAFAIHFPLPP